MAVKPDYVAGTISIAAGGTIVTGVGTLWQTATIQAGDTFKVKNLDAIIASVQSDTQLTLKEAWTGGALAAGSSYAIRFQPDGSRFAAAYSQLYEFFQNGSVAALQGLTGLADKIPYFTGAGTMALVDFKAWARSFLGLTAAADKLAYFSSSTAMALIDFRAWGRTFLGEATLQDAAAAIGKPMVVLVTGQSNATLEQAYSWTPPVNLKIWNYTKVAGNVGTAFVSPSGTVMSLALAYGRKLAIENPHRTIYIINIALGANSIGGWLPSVVLPDRDVYTDIVANVPPALVAAGATQIDAYVWWQIEGDKGALAAYPAKFETMMARMRTNSWFKESTPTIIHGCSSNAISGDLTYGPCNKTLQAVVNADPQRRKFVYTAAIDTSFWTDTPKIHMTGAGYDQAGAMGVDAINGRLNGIQQQFVFDMDAPTGAPDVPPLGFTPVIVGTTTAGSGSYDNQTGYLWRNGKRRDFLVVLIWTAHTGTGAMQITGMPDAPINTGFPAMIYMSNVTFTSQVLARIVASGGAAIIQPLQANSNAASTVLPIDTAGTILVSGTYYVP